MASIRWSRKRTVEKERERVQIPAHHRSLVTQYAMEKWFDKHCPGRDRMLNGVPGVYKEYMAMCDGGHAAVDIAYADTPSLEVVAYMVGRAINQEQSLVDWIEGNNQSYPSDIDGWFSVCTAAGWLVIRTYFRERTVKTGGD